MGKGESVPGLGSVCSPGGILGEEWGGRGCSASWWGHSIPSGDGHLLGLRCILPTVGTEDHPVQLRHTGLMEAVGHTEVRVALKEGALGREAMWLGYGSLFSCGARGHLPHGTLTAVQK